MTTRSPKRAARVAGFNPCSRREYWQRAVGVGVGAALVNRPVRAASGDNLRLPTRVLRRTDARVTMGGFPSHRKAWVGCNTRPESLPQA
jgi:hypothetical protein